MHGPTLRLNLIKERLGRINASKSLLNDAPHPLLTEALRRVPSTFPHLSEDRTSHWMAAQTSEHDASNASPGFGVSLMASFSYAYGHCGTECRRFGGRQLAEGPGRSLGSVIEMKCLLRTSHSPQPSPMGIHSFETFTLSFPTSALFIPARWPGPHQSSSHG
jgi:hypothetical protein